MMKIVLSGVNLVEAGPLKVFKEAIIAFSSCCDFEVICLVNNEMLFSDCKKSNVTFLEFPTVKNSWLNRFWFEYKVCYRLSQEISADIWFAMHDISPRVCTPLQFVYCHNPSPFYRASMKELKYERKLFLFSLLYKWLYKINIKSNKAVIVQQEWIGKFLVGELGARDYIVSKPLTSKPEKELIKNDFSNQSSITFFFPALDRTFKNFEVILNALSYLKDKELNVYKKIRVILTINEFSGEYARKIVSEYQDLEQVEFLGTIDYDEVIAQYKKCDVVLFPSKLETWGLPISEAKEFSKPIILSDLPYAHETLGNYTSATFFSPDEYVNLAEIMKNIVDGKHVFEHAHYEDSDAVVGSWKQLVEKFISIANEK
ncbi:putative glycosyl transferase [Vibrio atlanticus]|uniref:Glycosyl transferase n=2 Tax=Vibrio atlanticus TaxID=693153 RepID=B7VHP5_VIBA3|nr:putative glycosyl transferase [Vibrio atlanticus]